MNDAELLQAWGRGDGQAAESLVTRYYDPIVRFFQTKGGEDAEDLVQQTFVRCGEAAGRYSGTSTVRSFLFGIARNVLYEHIRARVKRRQDVPDFRESALMDLQPGAATLADVQAEQRALVLGLQQVPLESQMLLELYYWEDLSVGELASMFDVAAGTIKSRLHRARTRLSDAIATLPPNAGDRATARRLIEGWIDQVKALDEA